MHLSNALRLWWIPSFSFVIHESMLECSSQSKFMKRMDRMQNIYYYRYSTKEWVKRKTETVNFLDILWEVFFIKSTWIEYRCLKIIESDYKRQSQRIIFNLLFVVRVTWTWFRRHNFFLFLFLFFFFFFS